MKLNSRKLVRWRFDSVFSQSRHRSIDLERLRLIHSSTSPAAASHISIYMLATNATISFELLHAPYARSLTRHARSNSRAVQMTSPCGRRVKSLAHRNYEMFFTRIFFLRKLYFQHEYFPIYSIA